MSEVFTAMKIQVVPRNVGTIQRCHNLDHGFDLRRENLKSHTLSTCSSSAHEVRPINDLFQPHDYIHPVVSLTVVQLFVFL